MVNYEIVSEGDNTCRGKKRIVHINNLKPYREQEARVLRLVVGSEEEVSHSAPLFLKTPSLVYRPTATAS